MKKSYLCVLLVLAAMLLASCGHEHTFGNWEVVKAACTEEGLRERVCSECGEKETETIPIAGHKFGGWTVVKEAACTEDGAQERVCSECGEKETETIPMTGHDFGEWTVVEEPDYENEGINERVCVNCGEKETEAIAKLEIPTYQLGETIIGEDVEITIYDLKHDKYAYQGKQYQKAEFTVDMKNTAKTKYAPNRFDIYFVYGDGYMFEDTIADATYIDPLETYTFERHMDITEEQFYDSEPKKILIRDGDSYDKERDSYGTCWYVIIQE